MKGEPMQNTAHTLSRRSVVAGCTALAAGALAAPALANEATPVWDYEADVVVVGGGCSGWAATWEAMPEISW